LSRTTRIILIAVGVLVAATIIILWLSSGKSQDNAHAATASAAKYGLPHCTRKHPCTKKQARKVRRYTNRGHNQGSKRVRARRAPTKVRASAVQCRSWSPRLYFIAKAGKVFWGGFHAHWCWNWHRVTSATVTEDGDVTTLGRFLGFDHIGFQEPLQGFYGYGHRANGGYLMYARMTFEQCIPVIQIGPLCTDHREWRKIFLHYNGGGLASSHAP
jgi:hypothetical protein